MNIWGILLQTMEVSLVALLILLLKWLFEDKLSPRWQYGIWALLALRIVIPTGLAGRYFSLDLAACLDILKIKVESGCSSVYSGPFSVLEFSWALPFAAKGGPVSVTDWLLVLYLAGGALMMLKYAVSYVRLRAVLRQGEIVELAAPGDAGGDLPKCRAVMVDGLPSAFVCGIFRPVLAVPMGDEPDSKVMLHELMHLKYRDNLQSVFWCVFRCLHWFNPLMQYVFNRIGNDMESLCDQRVLERLEGEERRDYGRILLAMTDDRYARAPGTTSVSNGGKNIARRIKAMVRFKKYPKGMGLVSVCIALVLTASVFAGSQADALNHDTYNLRENDRFGMAKARLTRCTTLAGAVDTWVKGQVFNYPGYLAASLPESAQEELLSAARDPSYESYWDNQEEMDDIDAYRGDYGFDDYMVCNLQEKKKNEFRALVVLAGRAESGDADFDGEQKRQNRVLVVPVEIRKEGRWVVSQAAKAYRQKVESPFFHWDFGVEHMPSMKWAKAEMKTGQLEIYQQKNCHVNNQEMPEENLAATNFNFGGMSHQPFDQTAKPGAAFEEQKTIFGFVWKCSDKRLQGKELVHSVAGLDQDGKAGKSVWSSIEEEMRRSGGGSSTEGWIFNHSADDEVVHTEVLDFDAEQMKTLSGFEYRIYDGEKLLESYKISLSSLKNNPKAQPAEAEAGAKPEADAKKNEKRCTTAAGAIDMLVKGMMDENPDYLKASGNGISEESAKKAASFAARYGFSDYSVINYKKEEAENKEYSAVIEIKEFAPGEEQRILLVPVRLVKAKYWYAAENGNCWESSISNEDADGVFAKNEIVPLKNVAKTSGKSVVFVRLFNRISVAGSSDSKGNPDAVFADKRWTYRADLRRGVAEGVNDGIYTVGVALGIADNPDNAPKWAAKENEYLNTSSVRESGWGYGKQNIAVSWDGNFEVLTGSFSQKAYDRHGGLAVRLYENDKLRDVLWIERGELLCRESIV